MSKIEDSRPYSESKIIYNIQKEYPDKVMFKSYNRPLYIRSHLIKTGQRQKREDWTPDDRSVRRSHQLVSDYVICNRFDLFCTFTFDPKKFKDRYDFVKCSLSMQKWLHSQRSNHSPELKYLVIPEHHKSGAIHFHALLTHFNGVLSDSGHIWHEKPVYNISGWKYGFSTCQKIPLEDVAKVSKYVRKYITKETIAEFGRRRFLVSRNLQKPVKSYNTTSLRDCLPIGRKEIYDAGEYVVYELDPQFFQRVKKQAEKYADLIKRQREEEEKRLYFSSY